MASVVAIGGVTFVAPTVHGVFVGVKGKDTIKQSLAPLPQTLADDASTDVKAILVVAARDRAGFGARWFVFRRRRGIVSGERPLAALRARPTLVLLARVGLF